MSEVRDDAILDNTIINALGRPVALHGAKLKNCTINCDYIQMNSARDVEENLNGCRVNARAGKQILK